jgi:integrase
MSRLQKGERKYKFEREDVIRKPELDRILRQAGSIQIYGLSGNAWQALVAILWLFGKRIGEVVNLKSSEVFTTNSELCIRFKILKKESRRDSGVRKTFTKRITLENEYVPFVLDYWDSIKHLEGFMFPRSQTPTGHIYRQYAWSVLKSLKPDISYHQFRHSLATHMAEDGASANELVSWFDWDGTDTALEYVKRGGTLTERLSKRK